MLNMVFHFILLMFFIVISCWTSKCGRNYLIKGLNAWIYLNLFDFQIIVTILHPYFANFSFFFGRNNIFSANTSLCHYSAIHLHKSTKNSLFTHCYFFLLLPARPASVKLSKPTFFIRWFRNSRCRWLQAAVSKYFWFFLKLYWW